MSTLYPIQGSDIVEFRSKSSNPVITLRAENGKTLSIQGYTSSTTTTKTTTQLGYYEINTATTVTHNNAALTNQGYFCELANASNYFVTSGPKGPASGGGGVFLLSSGTWTQQALLTSSNTSTSFNAGTMIHINEDGSLVVMASQPTGAGTVTLDIYSRSGSTWTLEQSYSDRGSFARIASDRMVTANAIGQVTVCKRTAGTWTQEQEIQPFTVGRSDGSVKCDISTFNGTAAGIIVFDQLDPKSLALWTRVNTTWTHVQDIYFMPQDTEIQDFRIYDTLLVVCMTNRVYVYEWTALGSLFELVTVLELAYTRVVIANTTKFAVCRSNQTVFYTKDSTSGQWQQASTASITSATSFAMNSSYFATGHSTLGNNKIYSLDTYDPVVTVPIVQFDTNDNNQLTMTTEFPIVVSNNGLNKGPKCPALYVDGDLTCVGNINGILRTNYAYMRNTYDYMVTPAIANNTATLLNDVFNNGSGLATENACTKDIVVQPTTGKILVYKDGFYMIQAQVSFDANLTGSRSVYVKKNGTDIGIVSTVGAAPDQFTVVNLSGLAYLVEDDYIQLYVLQTSGSPVDLKDIKFSCLQIGS